ncbi:MAG TPA: GNAT family N-acetyltransferase [Candidatus Bathyarchaeia archaeon]|nr:GNAT family N-acetyltransferase [Candidatus Bathyarchaeia archaeon]
MVIQVRPFNWKNDYYLIQQFLIETFHMSKDYENWLPTRFENRKVGPCGSEYREEEDDLVTIWEEIIESGSKIVAVVILENDSFYTINIHPEYKSLEKEIILWIESKFQNEIKSSIEKKLHIFAYGTDKDRITTLKKLDYTDQGFDEYDRKFSLNNGIANYTLPQGYSIKHVDTKRDFLKYRDVMGAVFPHCKKMTERTFKVFTKASFYHPELDIISVAPDGSFAAFCTIRLDPIGKIAELEPVGTHPNHRRLGLGKAVILEGLKRLEKFEPKAICIPGAAANEAANRLYDSLGFTDKTEVHLWQKEL